eukprot:TRINITY_DN3204_c0_g1_i2.p1 TRINITY_DN3204_c0_g1~~TRINITY_DN3204_c0_g1_i2.p1  ORF type:complete len:281 (-),score=69.84 TRINITY_DN3204_c0_g1_i2:84-926(-)
MERKKHAKRSVSRSISRKVKPVSKKALEDEKFSLNDDCELRPEEYTWTVTMKPPEGQGFKKLERVLTVGPTGIRLLLPDTLEEVGKFPYTRMREFSQNETLKVFQFTWFPNDKEEETFFFKTAKCVEIQNQIAEFIKDILKRKKVDNPDKILESNTYQRDPNIERMKMGGRQRVYSEDFSKTTKRPKEDKTTPMTSPTEPKSHSSRKKAPRSPASPHSTASSAGIPAGRSPENKARTQVTGRAGTTAVPKAKMMRKQKPKAPSSSSEEEEDHVTSVELID